MTTSDANGSIHGADGKFSNKSQSESAGGTSALTPGPITSDNPNAIDLHDNSPFAPMNAVLVMPGQTYGRDDRLTNDGDEPLLEFYDARFPHTPNGQFVSRYYLSTLSDRQDRPNPGGLDLQGDVATWSVTSESMERAVDFAEKTANRTV